MGTRQLKALLRLLRSEGVTRYENGALKVELGAAHPGVQGEQRKRTDGGADVTIPEVTPSTGDDTPPITDLAAWLETKYAEAGR